MFIIEALKAIFLGIVEGITEWLPISSTGHMILVNEFLHTGDGFFGSQIFLYVIQLGAILAVATLYFHKLNPVFAEQSEIRKSRNMADVVQGYHCLYSCRSFRIAVQ